MNRLATAMFFSATILSASVLQAEPESTRSSFILAQAEHMEGHDGHDMGHDGGHDSMVEEAIGVGTLHNVDAEQSIVNLTHDPIQALNWPTMTMDLAVSHNVDLSNFQEGDKVQFSLKQGRDKVYRIMQMCQTDAADVVEGLCTVQGGVKSNHDDHSH